MRAAAVEALGERSRIDEQGGATKLIDRAETAAWLAAPGRRTCRAKTSRRPVTDRMTLQTRETARQIMLETLDAAPRPLRTREHPAAKDPSQIAARATESEGRFRVSSPTNMGAQVDILEDQ